MHATESSVVGLIRRHPMAAYLLWLVTVGWAIAFVPIVARSAFGAELPFQPFAIVSTVVGALLPALVITRVVDGPQALRELGRRSLELRASPGWYAFALLALPLPALVVAMVLFGLPEANASTFVSAFFGGLLLQGLITFITINFVEEIAWMGFFQARLQPRHGAVWAAVLTAGGFTLMHLPLFVANATALIVVLPLFFVMAIGFRALVGWVYNHTCSLFLVGLAHAAGNAAGGGSGFSDGLLPRLYDSTWVRVLHTIVAFVIGLGLIAATRGRLGAPPRRTGDTETEEAPTPTPSAGRRSAGAAG